MFFLVIVESDDSDTEYSEPTAVERACAVQLLKKYPELFKEHHTKLLREDAIELLKFNGNIIQHMYAQDVLMEDYLLVAGFEGNPYFSPRPTSIEQALIYRPWLKQHYIAKCIKYPNWWFTAPSDIKFDAAVLRNQIKHKYQYRVQYPGPCPNLTDQGLEVKVESSNDPASSYYQSLQPKFDDTSAMLDKYIDELSRTSGSVWRGSSDIRSKEEIIYDICKLLINVNPLHFVGLPHEIQRLIVKGNRGMSIQYVAEICCGDPIWFISCDHLMKLKLEDIYQMILHTTFPRTVPLKPSNIRDVLCFLPVWVVYTLQTMMQDIDYKILLLKWWKRTPLQLLDLTPTNPLHLKAKVSPTRLFHDVFIISYAPERTSLPAPDSLWDFSDDF